MSNEEIEPLFEENDEMLKAALLKDEDETYRLLGCCMSFSLLDPYFSLIQQHFKSKKIANRLNETLDLLRRGMCDCQMPLGAIREIQKMVDEANKYVD